MTQGERWRAQGLSLEVPDGRGGWIVAQDNLGFPAGRKKTILVDLTNVFRPGTPRRYGCGPISRSTGISIEWARGLPDTPLKTRVSIPPWRIFTIAAIPSSTDRIPRAPEVPDYNRISGTQAALA